MYSTYSNLLYTNVNLCVKIKRSKKVKQKTNQKTTNGSCELQTLGNTMGTPHQATENGPIRTMIEYWYAIFQKIDVVTHYHSSPNELSGQRYQAHETSVGTVRGFCQ